MSKAKPVSFSPYFRLEDADQVRAAFDAAGKLEGYGSISEMIEDATLRKVKSLQRKHNNGKPWPPIPAAPSRAGRPRKDTSTSQQAKDE